MNEEKAELKGNDRHQGSEELKNGQEMMTHPTTKTTDEQRRELKREESINEGKE